MSILDLQAPVRCGFEYDVEWNDSCFTIHDAVLWWYGYGIVGKEEHSLHGDAV